MNKFRQYLALLLLAVIFTGTIFTSPRIVHADTKEDFHLSLTVFGKITTQTDKVRVYEVQDVTPPKKPEVSFLGGKDWNGWIDVEGEKGCDVYIRHNSGQKAGRWKYMGTLTDDLPESFIIDIHANINSVYAGDTFSIRFVDDAGNKSKTVTTEEVKEDWEDD